MDSVNNFLNSYRYYPLIDSGPLCPLLNSGDTLLDFYTKSNKRNEIKAFCKKTNWAGKPKNATAINDIMLKPLLISLFNSHEARKKLEMDKNDLSLCQVIWIWLSVEHKDLFKKVKSACHTHSNDKNKLFISVDSLIGILSDLKESSIEEKKPVVLTVLAFSMLQKDDRSDFFRKMIYVDPSLREYLDVNPNSYNIGLKEPDVGLNTSGIENSPSSNQIELRELSKFELFSYKNGLIKIVCDLRYKYAEFKASILCIQSNDAAIDFCKNGPVFAYLENLNELTKDICSLKDELFLYFKSSFKTCCSESCQCREFNFDTSFDDSITLDEIISIAEDKQKLICDFVDGYESAKKAIQDIARREDDILLRSGKQKEEKFLELESDEPCAVFSYLSQYRVYVDEISEKLNSDISDGVSRVRSKLNFLKDFPSKNCNDFFVDLKKEIGVLDGYVQKINSISDIEQCERMLLKIESKYKDHDQESISLVAKRLVDDNEKSFQDVLELSRLLILHGKNSLSFLLLHAYQQVCNDSLSPEQMEHALGLIVESLSASESDFFSLPTLSGLIKEQHWFSVVSSEDIQSSDLNERMIILFLAFAFAGELEFSSAVLNKLNALEASRSALPKIIGDIVRSIVSQRPVKIINQDVLASIGNKVKIIEERIAFEGGKYKHVQRNSKYFPRFETLVVFPALTDLWRRVSALIECKNYSQAKIIVSRIDISDWYEEMLSNYDKELADHHHYSVVVQKSMEDFLHLVSDYIDYHEFAFSTSFHCVIENELADSVAHWSGSIKSRKSIANIFLKSIKKIDSTKHLSTMDIEIMSLSDVISSCPNTVISIRDRMVLFFDNILYSQMLRDLSTPLSLNEIIAIYTEFSAWGVLSYIYEKIDVKIASEMRQRNEIEIAKLDSKVSDVESFGDPDLSIKYRSCLLGGRFPAAYKILERIDSEYELKIEEERKNSHIFIKDMLNRLEEIKDLAIASNMADYWKKSVCGFSFDIDIKLRNMRQSDFSSSLLAFEKLKLEKAIESLRIVVDSNSLSFDEIEYHLAPIDQQETATDIVDVDVAKKNCPDLIRYWSTLAGIDHSEDIKKSWLLFVKEFAKISSLYHDEGDDKKRFGIVHPASQKYTYSIFQTAFYKPQSEFLKRNLRLYLYRNDGDSNSLSRLQDELFSEDSASMLHVVFVPIGIDKIQRYFDYDKAFKNFLLVDEQFLYTICAHEKHEVPIRQALHASVTDLANSSPFVAQGYCHQANNIYVGRKDALQKLLNNPQAMIWGGRRIGKTSVLHALENALARRNYNVAYVYVDIQDDGDPDLAIAKKIALTLKLGDIKNITMFERKISDLRRHGVKVAFLIDEVDEYIKKSRKVHGAAFPLATALRQLVMDDNAKDTFLVYSGYHQLYYEAKLDKEKRRVGHPFINITQHVPIRDLTYDDVEELVKTGFRDMLGITINPDVPRLIAQRASRHPAFVQQFCRCLLEHVSMRRAPGDRIKITTDDVEIVYANNVSKDGGEQAFILYVSETLGYNLSHLGRAVMLALIELTPNASPANEEYYLASKILEQLNEWCGILHICVPKPEHFEQTIELLIMTNMLTQDPVLHDRYRFTYPTYLEILKRLDKIGRSAIDESLIEYDKTERDKGILL